MPRRVLRLVPKPPLGTRVIRVPDNRIKSPRGVSASDTLVCGACEMALLDIRQGIQLWDIIFRCAGCGAYNDPTPMDA